MLYQLYETQRALMAPFAEFANASSKLYSHPLSPFNHAPLAQRDHAGGGGPAGDAGTQDRQHSPVH